MYRRPREELEEKDFLSRVGQPQGGDDGVDCSLELGLPTENITPASPPKLLQLFPASSSRARSGDGSENIKHSAECNTSDTPKWRNGSQSQNICNSCGRHAKRKNEALGITKGVKKPKF